MNRLTVIAVSAAAKLITVAAMIKYVDHVAAKAK